MSDEETAHVASTEQLLARCVYLTVYATLLTPLYIYGLVKWWQFQPHFLVAKRFPMITNVIVILGITNTITVLIRNWTYYQSPSYQSSQNSVAFALLISYNGASVYVMCGLLFTRIILIYLRHQACQHAVKQLTLPNNVQAEQLRMTRLYKHPLVVLHLLCLSVAFVLLMLNGIHQRVQNDFSHSVLWPLQIISGISFIVIVKCKRVNEGIGALMEVYLTLVYLVFAMIISFAGRGEIFVYVRSLAQLQPLLPVFISLWLVRRCEGTLSARQWRQRYRIQVLQARAPSQSAIEIVTVDSLGNSEQLQESEEEEQSPKCSDDVRRDLKKSCLEFLEEHENYKLFAEYLAHCFAIENLAFLERVSIFNQIVLKLAAATTLATDCQAKLGNVRRVKFEYLQNIYQQYSSEIEERSNTYNVNEEHQIGSFEFYKDALYDLCQQIYDEFIDDASLKQVNLSYEHRHTLLLMFTDKRNLVRLTCFEDFVAVFDDAMVEVYGLLISIYCYKFKQYCRR